MLFRLPTLILSVLVLAAAATPETVPLPEKRPKTASEQAAPEQPAPKPDSNGTDVTKPAAKPPIPEEKPAQPDSDTPPKDPAQTPASAPATDAPSPPAASDEKPADTAKPEDDKAETPATKPIEAEEPAAYAACMTDLKAMGATFTEETRIDDGKGCGIDKPINVTMVLPGVALAPKGTMRCETALELARWTQQSVLPAAAAALAEEGPLTTINQASSYICRLRNNAATGKISEHARGNAIDIASFTFKSGKSIAIQPRDDDSTMSGAFQRAVTATGCLYFETVLDPGSDEAHENHLHFDVLQRKGGYRYCR